MEHNKSNGHGLLFFNAVAPTRHTASAHGDVESGEALAADSSASSKHGSSKFASAPAGGGAHEGGVKKRLMSLKLDKTNPNGSVEQSRVAAAAAANSSIPAKTSNLSIQIPVAATGNVESHEAKNSLGDSTTGTNAKSSGVSAAVPTTPSPSGKQRLTRGESQFSIVIHSPRASQIILQRREAENKASWWRRLMGKSLERLTRRRPKLISDDFSDIYFFQKPVYYFRAVELCIMFNCLYLALWATNFVFIVDKLHIKGSWTVGLQLIM